MYRGGESGDSVGNGSEIGIEKKLFRGGGLR